MVTPGAPDREHDRSEHPLQPLAEADLDDEIERKERESQAEWDEAERAAGREPDGWDDYPLWARCQVAFGPGAMALPSKRMISLTRCGISLPGDFGEMHTDPYRQSIRRRRATRSHRASRPG